MNESPDSPILNGPKRQHYVSRFYLDGFSRSGNIAVYDRVQGKVRIQSTSDTGVSNHFYTVKDGQGKNRFGIEEMLSKIESDSAPTIIKMSAQREITIDERTNIAMFVAMAISRTPGRIEAIKARSGDMFKFVIRNIFSDLEVIKKGIRRNATPQYSEEEVEKEAKELIEFAFSDNYNVKTHKKFALKIAIDEFSEIAPILSGRNWLVLHRDSEKHSFITSDAPVLLTTIAKRVPSFWGVGFGNSDALVMFPLTESCSLMIFGNEGKYLHRTIDSKEIRRLNLMFAAHSHRFIFARDIDLLESLTNRLNMGRQQADLQVAKKK